MNTAVPLHLSRKLAWDIHGHPDEMIRSDDVDAIARIIDAGVRPLLDLLKRSRNMLESTGYQQTTPTIAEIDAALRSAGAE